MNIDTYTRTADTHSNTGLPNQDGFAVRSLNDNSFIIAVSDGCSSMDNSHYTSLDLARKAVSCETLEELLALNIEQIRFIEHGHATLVWALNTLDKTYIVLMGDGIWGAKYDNSVMSISLDWNDIPPYPTYEESLLNSWPGFASISSIGNVPEPITKGTIHIWEIPNNWSQFWISTDGLLKVTDLGTINSEVTALKNNSGQFLKRRLSRWLKGSAILDDISVISVIQEKLENEQSMG